MRTKSCRRRCLAAVVPSQAHRCRSTTDTASTRSTTDSASLTYPQRAGIFFRCSSAELSIGDDAKKEGRWISVSVYIGGHTDSSKCAHADKQADILIGSIFVSGKTKWELLDNIEYVLRVDPVSNVSRSARCAWIPSLTLAGVRAARGSRL
ncbi:PREDICTED: neuron navigator 3-like isoform X3 [Priapulus caudatus]|uniref:Neuron navigator 3-like isoform X3 n=1 Tax=Priapulus caudatus TaxID=37621 RepID=A0ABM1F443_PRICU|nr:PREDICTED: neuron navigator 3-like isoform X3 [Priapulus caudatus]